MSSSARRRARLLIAALFLLAPFIIISGGGVSRADFSVGDGVLSQEASSQTERTLKKSSWPNEVVKITKLKIKKGPVEFDKKFIADDDRLRGLTLTVKNISDKPIIHIGATITLFKKGARMTRRITCR